MTYNNLIREIEAIKIEHASFLKQGYEFNIREALAAYPLPPRARLRPAPGNRPKQPPMQPVRHFLLALQFFTRIPVTGRLAAWAGYSPAMLRAAAAHFPGVGWVIGLCGAAALWLALALLGTAGHAPLAAAALATAATVWLTGGFHEDGLADTCDGLGGSASRERALEIMKDSRIGSYGTLALALALALKISLLATLAARGGPARAALALLCAHVLSRFAPLLLMRALPYVSDSDTSKSKPLADAVSTPAVLAAAVWAAPALALLAQAWGPAAAALALAALLAALAWLAALLRRRLQGFTGDTLGATQQICELALYLALAAAPGLLRALEQAARLLA